MWLVKCIILSIAVDVDTRQKATDAFMLHSVKSFVQPITKSSARFALGPPCSRHTTTLSSSIVGDETGSDDDDDEEPGKMKVSEIKAELNLRGVLFNDCFDKEALVSRLHEARQSGRANPEILNRFNKEKLEASFKGKGDSLSDISDDNISAVLSSDGKLPGGLTPEQLKKLVSNPELMAMLQSVRMQEVMKLMMTSGPEALQKAMEEDEEIKELVRKLNEVMMKTM